ncbi:MAG: sensor domain-containing diguanylate cyclase [Pseudomonadota bacterium]
MKTALFNQRFAILLVLALGVASFYATYMAIGNIVAEQSRVQQQAVSPVFKLVRDELLRPLYIAETFASSVEFTTAVDSEDLDESALLARLGKMQRDLGLVFFVASERSRKQYLSDGTTLDLVEGDVAWYFEAKNSGKDIMADLGQVGDVHLFFDVKMYGPNGEFLGFVGVGKPVQRFLDSFNAYKASHNYDFLFVNERNEIILSSLPELVVTDAYIPTLESTAWFPDIGTSQRSYDSEIVDVEDEDFLISEFGIEELGWRLLLLVPLEARQAQVTSTFLSNSLATALIVLLLAGAFLFLLILYKQSIERKTELDALTGLPNRKYVQRRFEELRRAGVELCAIIVDLDHFKSINDTHGHDAGDRVLKAAADTFQQQLREEDIVGRWGGEEFVMIVPASSIERGATVAERARKDLEDRTVETREASLSVTASFGVAFGSAKEESLDSLLARADEMLYSAKQRGRNLVEADRSGRETQRFGAAVADAAV